MRRAVGARRKGEVGCGRTRLTLDSDSFMAPSSRLSMSTTDYRAELLTKLEDHKKLAEANEPAARAGEASTINFLVRPFVEDVLGFSFKFPNHVDQEFDVGAPGKFEKVDIALIVGERPAVLVEVKRRGERLGRSNIAQLQNYFTWVRTAKFAVLTDGIEWRWFKGKTGVGNDNYMEDAPFLVHNVLSPAEDEIDWVWRASKQQFDAERLTALSRQIEFTGKVRDWILGMVNPNAERARDVNKWLGLGASSSEIPLVEDAMREAWGQLIGGSIGDPGPVAHVADNTDADDPAEHPSSPIESVRTNDQSSSFTAEDAVALQFESSFDERVDLGDGRDLDADKMKRALRVGNRNWQVEKNGTETTTAALGELLKCDRNREEEQRVAKKFGLRYTTTKPQRASWRLVPGFSNIYWNMNRNNYWKAMLLEDIASKIEFDPPPDSPLADMPRIEWWLPDKPKR